MVAGGALGEQAGFSAWMEHSRVNATVAITLSSRSDAAICFLNVASSAIPTTAVVTIIAPNVETTSASGTSIPVLRASRDMCSVRQEIAGTITMNVVF